MSSATKLNQIEQKIAEGAIQILTNPGTFCKGSWMKEKAAGESDINFRPGFDELKRRAERGEVGSLANPNFQVCGQGAIYASAALQGYSYDQARAVVLKVEQETGSIPDFNDGARATRLRVRALLEKGFSTVIPGYTSRGKR